MKTMLLGRNPKILAAMDNYSPSRQRPPLQSPHWSPRSPSRIVPPLKGIWAGLVTNSVLLCWLFDVPFTHQF